MSRITVNGVSYNVVGSVVGQRFVAGHPAATPLPQNTVPLVLLHGFSGSVESWVGHTTLPLSLGTSGEGLGARIAIDALGHGGSDAPADPARYSMSHVVADMLAIMDNLGVGRFALLGYSMGGRMALHIAADAPERVSALILESASPGLTTPAERTARIAADAELAAYVEREGITAFVERWEKLPLFASQSDEIVAAQRVQRLANTPRGLANSLRGAGTGAQGSLRARLPDIRTPTLLIAGALDPKFAAIATQMHAALPESQLRIVSGAGHAVHLETPHTFDTLVAQFLHEQADIVGAVSDRDNGR